MSRFIWKRFPIAILSATIALCALAPGLAGAASHHLILSGSGGEEFYQQQFQEWNSRLYTALTQQLSIPKENVTPLAEPLEGPSQPESTISLDTIYQAFDALSKRVQPEDDLYVYLIGHGSHFKRDTKLHIPSRDLTAGDLADRLDAISARRIVLVVAISSGAGFINSVSGPDRVILSATKGVDEINATEFMEFFIEGLESGSADGNRDERITIIEAAHYATQLTNAWFVGEGLIATEHAILDDNGDGLGTRLPIEGLGESDIREEGSDGILAAVTYLKEYSFDPTVPQELINTYVETLDLIFQLKREKESIEPDAYYAELERLLIIVAKANRDIRRYPLDDAPTL